MVMLRLRHSWTRWRQTRRTRRLAREERRLLLLQDLVVDQQLRLRSLRQAVDSHQVVPRPLELPEPSPLPPREPEPLTAAELEQATLPEPQLEQVPQPEAREPEEPMPDPLEEISRRIGLSPPLR